MGKLNFSFSSPLLILLYNVVTPIFTSEFHELSDPYFLCDTELLATRGLYRGDHRICSYPCHIVCHHI